MKEHVGVCCLCGKDVYCLDGFLNGIVEAGGQLTCMECSLEGESEGDN